MDHVSQKPDTDLNDDLTETVNILQRLIQQLVDYPECVNVSIIRAIQITIFEVKVHPEDIRRLIGRKGRTADALRIILNNIGGKTGKRFILEIIEPTHRIEEVPSSLT